MDQKHPLLPESLRRTGPNGPFVAVALVGLLAGALPPGPGSPSAYAASIGLLVVTLVAGRSSNRIPPRLRVIVPLVYVLSVAFLGGGSGGITSGTSVLVLLPIVWCALYLEPGDSAIVVTAAAVTLLTLSVLSPEPLNVDARRAGLWWAIGAMVAVAIHGLRRNLMLALAERQERQRQSEVLSDAARDLSTARSQADLLAAAVRYAAALAPGPRGAAAAAYYRLHGDDVELLAEIGARSGQLRFSLSDSPLLADIIGHRRPVAHPWRPDPDPAAIDAAVTTASPATVAGIPVRSDGSDIHGVLTVTGTAQPFSADVLERFAALGRVVELGLGETLVREELSRLATTDQLTGIENRRGLTEAVSHRGRHPFSFICVDIDNLKSVNDTRGHAAGDAVIVATARALHDSLRSGEVLARTGGDEFVIFLPDTGQSAAVSAAQRLLETVADLMVRGVAPRISVGVATGRSSSDPDLVMQRADEAMYTAKRLGGMQLSVG